MTNRPTDYWTNRHVLVTDDARKLAIKHLHLGYQRAHGLRTTVLRLSNTYGPRQLMRHNRQGFNAWFVRWAIDGETIQLFGDGLQKRALNDIDDVVDAFLAVAACDKTRGEVYHLGSSAVRNFETQT